MSNFRIVRQNSFEIQTTTRCMDAHLLHNWCKKYNEMIGAAREFRRMLYGTCALIAGFQHGGHYVYINFTFLCQRSR